MSALQFGCFVFDATQISLAELLCAHVANELADGAILRAEEPDIAINHGGSPEAGVQFFQADFVRVVEAVEHHAVGKFTCLVIVAITRTKLAGFGIALAIPRTEKNVLPTATLQHALSNGVVLAINP